MDGNEFDKLVRSLAVGTSRRSVIRGALGSAAAVFAARATGVDAARRGYSGPGDAFKPKVPICHLTGSGSYHLIEVSENAVDAHLAHGDGFLGSNEHCSSCGDTCDSNSSCVDSICTPNEPEGCEAGYAPDGIGGCYACDPGSASADGHGCIPCAAETYSDSSGQASCIACDDGYTTNGQTGATICTAVPTGDALICAADAQCQSHCPGANDQWCECGTTFDSGAPVCYRAINGCTGPRYCLDATDCNDDEACINLNGGCGGCDNYIHGQTGQYMGVCNHVCVTGD